MTEPETQKTRTHTVVQGDYRISGEIDLVLSTVLGSCVSVCLHDPHAQVGGMNHFLLPSRDGSNKNNIRYGAHAMELLINGLLKKGARRDRLQAKVFGGASMAANLRDIGQSNAEFAKQFLDQEGLPIFSESLGGTMARRVKFWPYSGKAQQLLIPNDPGLSVAPAKAPTRKSESVTLF